MNDDNKAADNIHAVLRVTGFGANSPLANRLTRAAEADFEEIGRAVRAVAAAFAGLGNRRNDD